MKEEKECMSEREGIANSIKKCKYSRDSPASFNCSMLEEIIPKAGRLREGDVQRERGYLALMNTHCGTEKCHVSSKKEKWETDSRDMQHDSERDSD